MLRTDRDSFRPRLARAGILLGLMGAATSTARGQAQTRFFGRGETVLADNDVGRAEDMTQTGRWGPPQKEDGRSFRVRGGDVPLSRVGIKAWWTPGVAWPEDVALAVTFKDTAQDLVVVAGWTGRGGIYGYPRIGFIGGLNDGKWKRRLLVCPRKFIRRHPDGPWQGNWSVLFGRKGNIAVDRIQVLELTVGLRQEAVRQALAHRAASVERLKKLLRHQPWTETTPLGKVDRKFKDMGFIPYARSYTQDVYPTSIPTLTERGARTLRTYATPDEFEPLQVAAYALKDVTLTASIGHLTGPGSIRADRDIRIRWVEPAPVRYGRGGSRARQWRTVPVWLRTNQPRPVKAGTSQAWYVTVRVPARAKAGIYKGTLSLTSKRDGAAAAFPIEFRVLPFVLDKADHVARGAYVASVIEDEYIRDLAEHGINSSSMFAPGSLQPKLVNGRCAVDLSPEMNAYLKKLKQAGFVRVVDFGGGDPWYRNPSNMKRFTGADVGSKEFEKYYAEFWRDIRRLEKEKGWPEVICCPFDEPVKSKPKIRNYLTCYHIVKKATPQTKVFCVFMNRRGAAVQLGRQADIWSCNGAFDANQAEKKRLAMHGIDKLFYTYTGCMASYRPGPTRYNAGFLPWHFDADGTYFWAYLWNEADPFNNLDGAHMDWSPVARDADGKVYACVSWEGFREGVDDRRYVETAARLAKQKNRKDVLARLDELKRRIGVGKESPESVRTKGLDQFFIQIQSPTVLDLHRAEVASMILQMLGQADRR